MMVWLPTERATARFGLTVSRRVGGSVIRNRVKRWLRESIRRQRQGLTGMDVVLIARTGAAAAGYAVVHAEVGALFDALRRDL